MSTIKVAPERRSYGGMKVDCFVGAASAAINYRPSRVNTPPQGGMMNELGPHSKELRKGRVSISGQIYLVTTTTLDRRPVFADFRLGRVLVNTMRHHAENGDVESLAFVIMADHFHWLFTLTGQCPLSKLIGQVKGAAAHQINHAWDDQIAADAAPTDAPMKRLGPIWQKGFHDRALRREENIRSVARYMVMNPVRAGIVKRIWDYPLWDAVWVEG
jgi:putative transposase